MGITYPAAPLVNPGDAILASQLAAQADAVNARLKMGPSCPWHILYYALSAFRQVRNPDGTLFPSQVEFFTAYQNVNPGDASWPDAGPGDPTGANLASQWSLFVWGDGGTTVYPEADRLANPAVGGLNLSVTDPASGVSPRGYWNAAKGQRGAWDPANGNIGSPALLAAVSHGFIRFRESSPHGVDWGGFLPSPEYVGPCATPSTGTPNANYTRVFTKLDGSGTTQTYGTCPENAGDLAGVYQTPFAYYLFLFGGSVVTLPANLWVEGPYTTSPQLRKTQNNFLDRAVNAFASGFRGTAAQGGGTGGLSGSFAFRDFMTRQYLLAPQRGSTGTDGVTVSPVYTRMTASGTGMVAVGTVLSSARTVDAGSVVTGFYVEAQGLSPVGVAAGGARYGGAVQVWRDGAVVGRIDLVSQSDGTYQGLLILNNSTAGGVWSVSTLTALIGSGAISVFAECTELMVYKPSVADAYLVLRCGGVEFSGALDGDGPGCGYATSIYLDYAQKGVITSHQGHVALPGSTDVINSNAVYEAARQMSKAVRMVPRGNLIGYEVSGGLSVLYFTRYALGLSGAVPVDLFDGIGPARTAITTPVWGRTYQVKGATGQTVTYRSAVYHPGDSFAGVQNGGDVTGTGTVWEVDGIRHVAEPANWTNEWVFGAELYPQNGSDSSVWKPSAYADVIGPLNRCIFGDPAAAIDERLSQHFAFGNSSVAPWAILQPEAPPEYNYCPAVVPAEYGFSRVNDIRCTDGDSTCVDQRRAFYQSCQMLVPWPEVDSVTADDAGVMKVTLKSRVQYCPTAPETISKDISTWDGATLDGEGWRTLENGIRRYLLYVATGQPGAVMIGDQAFHSGVASGFTDQPTASIFPRLYFVKQIPKPWTGSGSLVVQDSPTVHDGQRQTEWYLRAMCPAYVDGVTTAANACTTNPYGPYDYTFDALVFQASGGTSKWVSGLPSATTAWLTAADIRTDKPMGFGSLPTYRMTAEGFQLISKMINLLNRIAVRIPGALQSRGALKSLDTADASIKNANGDTVPPGGQVVGGQGAYAVWDNGSWPLATVADGDYGAWGDISGGAGIEGVATVNGIAVVSGAGVVTTANAPAGYRWNPDPDTDLAIYPDFLPLLTSNPVIYGSYWETTTTVTGYTQVSGHDQGTQCHPAGADPDTVWGNASGAWLWNVTEVSTTPTCMELTGGTLAVGSLPSGYAIGTRNDAGGVVSFANAGNGKTLNVTVGQASVAVIAVPVV